MNKAIPVEMQFFLISILWGSIILFVYDIFRILRRLVKHNGFFIALEDLIFWVSASVFIFAMIYQENNGIIRGFSVMGMAIGMVLYHFILSELFVKLVTKIIQILLTPIAIALKWIKRLLSFIHSKAKRFAKFILMQLKKITKSVKITLDKKKQKAALARDARSKVKLEKRNAVDLRKQAEKKKKEEQQRQQNQRKQMKKKKVSAKPGSESSNKKSAQEQRMTTDRNRVSTGRIK